MKEQVEPSALGSLWIPGRLSPGQMVGRYRVLSELGQGGMGEVYLAHDTWLKRDVALKTLPEASARDQKMQARFEHEAQILASLNHPNIAAIYDLEQSAQRYCLVLEFVRGLTLAERLSRGPVPLIETLRLFRQIAAALEAAHGESIIHRDLKPSNIKITPTGEVKVLDFGIAKIVKGDSPTMDMILSGNISGNIRDNVSGTGEAGAFSTTKRVGNDVILTDESGIIGTLPYMSPEQTRGGTIDQQVDLWAFGCVLYETLTGKLPFGGRSNTEIIDAIHDLDPDWRALPPAAPRIVRELIHQCLEKNPKRRLRDAGEARRRLEVALNGRTKQTQVIQLPQNTPSLWQAKKHLIKGYLILSITALIFSLGIWWGWQYLRHRHAPVRKYLVVVPFKLLNEPKNNVFSEGVARYVGAALTRVDELQVITQSLPSPETENGWIIKNLGASLILRGTMMRTPTQTRIEYGLFDNGERQIGHGVVNHSESFGALSQLAEDVAQSLGLDSPSSSGGDHPKLDVSIQHRYLEAIGDLPGEPFERFNIQPEVSQGEDKEKAVTRVIQLLGDIVNTPEGNSAVYYAALARAYLIKHSLTGEHFWFGQAKNACDRARDLDATAHQVQTTLGHINLDLGRYAEAIDDFKRALKQRPSYTIAKLGLAGAYDLNRQFSEAEQTYREAIALSPDYWIGYNELGYFYYIHGRYAEAVDQWKRVVQLLPGRDIGHTNLGNAYLYQGHLEAAAESYRQSLGTAETLEGYVGLGTALYYQGSYVGAIEAFNKGLQLRPNDPTLLGNLGDAYRQSSNFREAADAYDRSIRFWQSKFDTGQAYPDEIARQADSLAKRGRTTEALEKIQQALKLAPENINCMYSAVVVYTVRGEHNQALIWAKRAVENGYSATLFKLEPQLASLRTSPGFEQIIR